MNNEKFVGDQLIPNDLIPIREISRITGINTVTLRAWERRYGLLIPQRTPKGHRLYKSTDIERVREIQIWLARGVAVSKVKNLLADSSSHEKEEIDSVWVQFSNQIHNCINSFNRSALQQIFVEVFSLYPVEIVTDHLIIPIFDALQGKEFGLASKRIFLTSVLEEYLQSAIHHQRHAGSRGQKILLVSSSVRGDITPLLLVYSLLVRQFQVEYLWALDMKEILMCVNALEAQIIVLVGGEEYNIHHLHGQLKIWSERKPAPLMLVGKGAFTVSSLNLEGDSSFYSCETIQQVHHQLSQLVS